MFSLNNNEVLNDTDVIKLAAKGKAFSNADVTIVAELMKNQQHTSPLNPTGNIEVGQDNQGWPMIFTIGTDKKFSLIKLDSSVQGGYGIINLSDSLGTDLDAVSFAMTQDAKGRISITLAMVKKSGGDTVIFTASRLSNNFAETDWANFASLSHKIEGVDAAFKVEQMLMNISDDGKAPVSIVAGNLKGYKYYYLLNGSAGARKYEFPEDVKQHPDSLKDIAIGYAFGQTGIFFIYDIGESQTLACTTLADASLGSLSYDYSAGNVMIPEPFRHLTYNCISTPTGSKNKSISICSDIFVGSSTGVYCFKNASVNKCGLVTDKIKDVHELTIRQDKDSIVVWASTAGNKLYYIYGKKEAKGEKYVWNDPVLFKEDVLHIAPIRNTGRQGNELFLITQDKSIQHYWQDIGSTLWRQQVINVPEQTDVIEFNSYTTHLHFEGEKGEILIEEKVKITASEWVYVTINGFLYSLDQGSSAEVSTDIMGNITIITMTDDIACPIYHLTADWMDKTLNIYPNGKITKGLANIKSAADLKGAKTEDGKPVLSNSSYDDETLTAVAGNISQLADKGHELKSSNRNALDSYTFTAVENKGVLHTGRFEINSLPDNFMLSYGASGNLELIAAPGNIFDEIVNFAGDALHYLSEFVNTSIAAIRQGLIVLENGIQFVLKKIDEGLQFVLAIGDKILNIVLDTLGAVFKALNWVLKLIGIDLEKILEWLGKLIGWTDVLETSDKICDVINNGFDIIAGTADVLSDKITGIFRDIEIAIAGEDIVNKLGDTTKTNKTDGRSGPLQNPAANLATYHLIHGQSSPTLSSGSNDSFTEEIERVLKDLLEKEIFTAGKAISMIGDLLSHISTDSIGETITRLMQIIAVTVLEEVKHGIVALFSILKLLLNAIKAVINEKMDIPILSGLLKLILGGRELTVLRVVSIMVALPLRVIYRIATGDAFPHDKVKAIDVNEVNTLFKERLGVQPKAGKNLTDPEPADNPVYQTESWLVIMYEVTRSLEIIVGSFDLFNYLTSAAPAAGGWQQNLRRKRGQLSTIKSLLSLLSSTLSLANVADHALQAKNHKAEFTITDVTTYEIVHVALSSFKAGMGFIGAAFSISESKKKWLRGFSSASSLALTVLLIVTFVGEEKTRSNNLRFTSNLFLNLYKMVQDCPFTVGNPKVAAGICAADAVMGFTHVGLVAARLHTDADDRVDFKII
ncbi:hypothetical protein G7092_01395 [Mucilaginibacter sp. HC2]|uniref:hypothetical protein n=1 Tax=Mucilaginibacter inviolabilis TaxID=2714892 RepID=UPI001407B2FA|nr:hypothetical protein [Mucilaginibacter inviolabilis]NHA02427.1 hypothetical protein [Mucilaginibacter inviolabilis]